MSGGLLGCVFSPEKETGLLTLTEDLGLVDSNESLLFRSEEVELLFSEDSVGLDEGEAELLESLEDPAEVRLEAGDAAEL